MTLKHITAEEASVEALHDTVTANELDIVVSKTRQINHKREREIKQMTDLLAKIEKRIGEQ